MAVEYHETIIPAAPTIESQREEEEGEREDRKKRAPALIRDNCSRSRDDKGRPPTFSMQARAFSGGQRVTAFRASSRNIPGEENYASSFSLARKITGNHRNNETRCIPRAHAIYTCIHSSASWNLLCNYPPVTLASGDNERG